MNSGDLGSASHQPVGHEYAVLQKSIGKQTTQSKHCCSFEVMLKLCSSPDSHREPAASGSELQCTKREILLNPAESPVDTFCPSVRPIATVRERAPHGSLSIPLLLPGGLDSDCSVDVQTLCTTHKKKSHPCSHTHLEHTDIYYQIRAECQGSQHSLYPFLSCFCMKNKSGIHAAQRSLIALGLPVVSEKCKHMKLSHTSPVAL